MHAAQGPVRPAASHEEYLAAVVLKLCRRHLLTQGYSASCSILPRLRQTSTASQTAGWASRQILRHVGSLSKGSIVLYGTSTKPLSPSTWLSQIKFCHSVLALKYFLHCCQTVAKLTGIHCLMCWWGWSRFCLQFLLLTFVRSSLLFVTYKVVQLLDSQGF